MREQNKPQIIAIEEHYLDPLVAQHWTGVDANRPPRITDRLADLEEVRLQEMDDAGIDIQVLSHASPATQRMDAETAVPVAKAANDKLNETILKHSKRYAGFAVLPTADPKASADELERTVTKYSFKGAMIHGPSNGVFIDDKQFWPIFERAQDLDVPLYMHPSNPHPDVVNAYYADYKDAYPTLVTAAWGFTVETATQGIRLVLSGVLDKYPDVKIILGHLGESLPFSLWRINEGLKRFGNRESSFRDTFCEHFYITTSGNFSNPALLCCVMEMGVDRILFSVDWPFIENKPGADWALNDLPLGMEDREKILNGNARKLLKM